MDSVLVKSASYIVTQKSDTIVTNKSAASCDEQIDYERITWQG